MFNIFLTSQTFSWLLKLISDIFSIRGTSEFANFKTETCLILVIFMLSEKFSLYITSSRTFKILKGLSLVKSNLLLSLIIQINIIFIFSVLYRRYTLSLFLKVSPLTLFLLANFFIILLKNTKLWRSFFYNLWISFTVIIIYDINSSHFLIFIKTLALNSLFMKNGVLLVILYFEVLYASILMGNSLT